MFRSGSFIACMYFMIHNSKNRQGAVVSCETRHWILGHGPVTSRHLALKVFS